ncbi:hypothetical protein OE88DRAFT_1660028 [Heliocybe sulcata]|uniref:C2H2-type domain-containing protein n=1 Tax=Heliocybe sulcata TaxID=5364 RepID=A0A5C3NAN4_9AGAM|nr:hypothetical protein OE88DRAFT_1660028 [Heliocybe sulcata]
MQDSPPSFSCRWDWCRATFSSNKSLVDHVVDDHIKTAEPVKRRDVSLIRRAEEGQSGITDSLLVNSEKATSQSGDHASSASRFPESSPVAAIRTPSPSRAYQSPALTPPSTPPGGGQHERSPRLTFGHHATQSSPAVTPSIPSVSGSPPLSNLVANAISDLSSSTASRSRGSPMLQRPTEERIFSSPSTASTPDPASHAMSTNDSAPTPSAGPSAGETQTSRTEPDSIDINIRSTFSEHRLTQGLDIQLSESQHGASQTLQSPQPAAESPAYQVRTQAWYQSHPHPSASFASQSPSNSAHKTHQGHMHVHSHPYHTPTFTFRNPPTTTFTFSRTNAKITHGSSTHAREERAHSRPISASGERHGIVVHHVHHNRRHDHPHLQLTSDESGASTPSQSTSSLHEEEQVSQAITMDDTPQSLPLHLQMQTQAPYQSRLETQSTNGEHM